MIKTLCLSGGGLKGICILGCLNALEKYNFIHHKKINTFYATSVGSIISILLICNYSIQELSKFILQFDLYKLEPKIDCNTLFTQYGITEGHKLITAIQTMIYNKMQKYDFTFKEFYEVTKKKLYIFTTNFSTGYEEVFSYSNKPDVSVLLALRMSISIPFLFTPVKYNNNLYVDGGITNNFPINYIKDPNFFGICLHFSCYKYDTLYNYLMGCFNIVMQTINFKNINLQNKENIIIINNLKKENISESLFDFENKQKLYNLGENIAIKYIEKNNSFVKKVLLNNIIKNVIDDIISNL